MGTSFGLKTSQEGDEVIVWLRGEMDIAHRDQVTEQITACLHEADVVVADLSGLVFIDSSGLSALIACRKAATELGRQFTIRGAIGPVARVLSLTGIGELWTQRETA